MGGLYFVWSQVLVSCLGIVLVQGSFSFINVSVDAEFFVVYIRCLIVTEVLPAFVAGRRFEV